jgi:N-acetylmuramoyl-L-alanine amidase
MLMFRALAVYLAMACAALHVSHAAPVARLGTITLNGLPYIDLNLWGEHNGLAIRWNSKAGEMRLENRWTKLSFKADTRRLGFDDISVSLSYPVLRGGEKLYLALRDEETVLRPLLKPPRLGAGRKLVSVAISAGHGGKDPGNIEGGRQEKIYTLQVARELQRQLRARGFKVFMLRENDTYVSPEDRPAISQQRRADLHIAIHFNHSSSESAKGLETYCLTPSGASSTNDRGGSSAGSLPGNRLDRENLAFAFQVHRAVLSELDFEDRGVRHARFKELTLASMPAILIEGGFMSNPEDAGRIFSENGRVKYAAAIADGILSFKRLMERGQPE